LMLISRDDLIDMIVSDSDYFSLFSWHFLDSAWLFGDSKDIRILECFDFSLFGRDYGWFVLEDGLTTMVVVVSDRDLFVFVRVIS
jgi:hypothetical protein